MNTLRRFLRWAKQVDWEHEPIAVMDIVRAVLAALAGTGFILTDHQIAAIATYVTSVCLIAGILFARKKVYSPATVQTKQAAHDHFMRAASQAIAESPSAQDRARLCPGPPGLSTPLERGLERVRIAFSADASSAIAALQSASAAAAQFRPDREDPAPVTNPAGDHPQYKLGRLKNHDPRSRQFALPELAAGTPLKAVKWARRAPVLDQGALGSCTGNAAAGWICTDDQTRPGLTKLADGTTVDEKLAVAIYSSATALDDVNGSYPPDDTGSDGLSVAKVLQSKGLCVGYLHAFSAQAAYTALQGGPGMAGTVWYQSMFDTAADGHIHVDASSGVAGGHEYIVDELEVDSAGQPTRVWMTNSWGTGWGVQGRGYFTAAEFAALLKADGDFTVPAAPIGVPVPPEPTPAPAPAPDPGDATFQTAVATFPGLADALARNAAKHKMTVEDYAAWKLAGDFGER